MNTHNNEQKIAERLAFLTDKQLAGIELNDQESKEMHDLLSIIESVQETTKNTEPSPEFSKKLRTLVLNELQSPKAELNEKIQKVLTKLLGEETFRNNFFLAPEETLLKAGFQLSQAEIAALIELTASDQMNWFTDLDERISKTGLPGSDL